MRIVVAAAAAGLLGGLTLAEFGADAQNAGDGAAAAGESAWPEPVLADGRRKIGQCRTCHGGDGVATIPIAPHIGGESFDYIADQLAAFRSGAREHEMMTVVARNLSDQDIADVAAHYASFAPVATPPAGWAPENAPGLCVACHGADGIALLPEAPHLAGESRIYIETQLKAFRLGQRENEIMSPLAADLSDEEIRDYAKWYAEIGFSTEAPE